MSYPEKVSFRATREMRVALNELAAARQIDAGKLVRRLIAQELSGAREKVDEVLDLVLYIAIAMDGLLAAHPDPELRQEMLRLWKARLAEEGRPPAE